MVQLYYGDRAMNRIISHMDGVVHAVRSERDDVVDRAKANLAAARASTQWHKIYGPDHLTRVTKSNGEVDAYAVLEAPNPMAIEFGHQPSGVFGPGGRFGHVQTKAPAGLYILTKAARLA